MNSSDMVKAICKEQHISMAELARRLGQTPQNFNKKLKRGTLSYDEMLQVADIMKIEYEQSFIFDNGKRLVIGSKYAVVTERE